MGRMQTFWDFFGPLLGLGSEPKDLTFFQISLRGVIVFLATLIMVRLGHKRSLSRKTAFDAVLIVILASMISRAINGSAAFFAPEMETSPLSAAPPSIASVSTS